MTMEKNEFIIPNWSVPDSIRACTTTRLGGVSVGVYASFNLGDHVQDLADGVAQNRAALRASLALSHEPYWINQVHGTTVVKAHSGHANPVEADASWSDEKGVVCAILTADCLPVIIADKTGSCVAAAHAGWRSLLGGVLEKTVKALPSEADQLVAWLGPAIGITAFEVGNEVRDAFIEKDPAAVKGFIRHKEKEEKWWGNLALLAKQRLANAGVETVFASGLCTYTDPKRFYSYRRDGQTGRMATLIWRT